jgi:hypothetical protein
MTTRHGRPVAAHYGSAAGELAVCVRAVGVAERSELTVLALEGAADELTALAARLTDARLETGGCTLVGGAWWCRPTRRTLLVLGEASITTRLASRLRADARRCTGVVVRDLSDGCTPIGLVGRMASALLARLGAYGGGDARGAIPCRRTRLGDVEVLWLLESDRAALALVARDDADAAWETIAAAGRPFGLSRVGRDALDRFALLDRQLSFGP